MGYISKENNAIDAEQIRHHRPGAGKCATGDGDHPGLRSHVASIPAMGMIA